MKEMKKSQLERIEGGDYELCGVGVALTLASLWYAPYLSGQLAEATLLACLAKK